ncbi:MAG: DUF1624 domain-containing protein [Rhizobiaceae bacterium]
MHGKVAGKSRLEPLDLARGLALVAMAIYHFAWDLEFFGYAPPGMTAVGGWKLFARCIASSFLIIVGISLYLAHRDQLRLGPFLRRLALVAGAALAISLVTWFAVPGGFIFFGILHQIALTSVLGLLFLRWPWPLTLAVAALVIAAPWYLRSTFFDAPVWWWVGLSSYAPPSNDYVPLFPWFGAVLAGIAFARLAHRSGLIEKARVELGGWSSPFQFIGRHSLVFYLLHQPVVIGIVYLMSVIVPLDPRSHAEQFDAACQASCSTTRDDAFCTIYCVCVYDRLDAENGLDAAFSNDQDAERAAMLNEIAAMCTFDAEAGQPDGAGEEPASE